MVLLRKIREFVALPQRCMAACLALGKRVQDLDARLRRLEPQDHPYTFDMENPYTSGCTICRAPTSAIHPSHKLDCPNISFANNKPKGACNCAQPEVA